MDANKICDKVIASCNKVHEHLGPGYAERIYHSALKVVLEEDGLDFASEEDFSVLYKDIRVGSFKSDLYIEDCILLDVNASSTDISPDLELQMKAQLRAANKPVGLIVNFGSNAIQVRKLNN